MFIMKQENKKYRLFNIVQGTTLSVIDHASLSALNFLLGLGFINFGSKTDYGNYAQLFAFMILIQSIFHSLVYEPLLTLAAKKSPIKTARMESALLWYLTSSALLGSFLIYLLLLAAIRLQFITELSTSTVLPFSLAIFSLLMREYVRTVCFLRRQPARSLQVDSIYAISLCLGLLFFAMTTGFVLGAVFKSMIMANIMAVIFGLLRLRIEPIYPLRDFRQVIYETWNCAKWSLPRSVVTWLLANTYLYITSFFFGSVIVAEIAAARLFIMPLGLCLTAWEKIFLPRASRWLSHNDVLRVQQTALFSARIFLALVLLYFLLLVVSFEKIQFYLLANNYSNILPFVLLWGGWALVNSFRTVATNLLLAALKFQQLFHYATIVALLSLPITGIAAFILGPEATLVTYILSEVLFTYLTWYKGWSNVRKVLQTTNTSP